jgi:phosphoserine phosphatase RsbU/P
MILVVLDPAKHTAVVVNAGHMAPLHRRASGVIEEPSENIAGLPLGVTDALGYDQMEFQIEAGDTFTLYTDGVNESIDASGGFYTIDRMREHIKKHAGGDVGAMGQSLIDDVRRFLGKAPQNDDMCLVCVARLK